MLVYISCLLFILWIWWYKRPAHFPLGPRGFPLIGIIPFMTKRPEVKFRDWSKEYGPIMSVRVGRQDWVILNNIKVMNEALLKQGSKFSGRSRNYILDHLSLQRLGIAFCDGALWKEQRKFGSLTLRGLGVGRRSFENQVREEVSCFLQGDLTNAICNIISRVLFGERFEYDDESQRLIIRCISELMSDPVRGMHFQILILIPFLRFFPPFRSTFKIAKLSSEKLFAFLREIVERHKATFDPNEIRDFIDAYIVEMNRHGGYYKVEQLIVYIRDLFGAGMETTTSTLQWCFLGFFKFPQFQVKIHEEIDTVIGKDNLPSMAHRDLMPYTMAYLQELQRYCTLTPLAIPHSAVEDVEINGYFIPKNTQVITNIWSVHNDPQCFENPEDFRPERFLDGGKFVKSSNVIPFSIGPRNCIGEQLARMELFLFLTMILQKYVISPSPGTRIPELDDGVLGTVYAPRDFKLILTSRMK